MPIKRPLLRDGKPYTPASARQQAAAERPQRPQPIQTKRGPEMPGTNRRAPAAAQETFKRIQESRDRNLGLERDLAAQQSFANLQAPQEDEPQVAPVQSAPKPVRRGVAITPMQNGVPVAKPPVAHAPPTEQARPLAQKAGFVMDERYQELYLPSKFLSYDFKRVHVRQMTRGEIKAIIRAKASGSYRHLINAIGQTLDVDPYMLTLGDFWYIMYWHRVNSYKKSPFMVTWTCKNEDHIARTELPKNDKDGTPNAKYLGKETLKNSFTIDRSSIKELVIDTEVYVPLAQKIYDTYGLQVTPQTMADFANMMEAEEEEQIRKQAKQHQLGTQDSDDPEQVFKILMELTEESADAEVRMFGYRYAMLVNQVHGETIHERDEFLDQFPPEVTDDLEEFIVAAEHGVNESFHVTCAGCGASVEVKSSIDALSFLPAHLTAGNDGS